MLLFDYLVHEGLWSTANRVAQDILLGRVQVSEQVCFVFWHNPCFTASERTTLHMLELGAVALSFPVCCLSHRPIVA